MATATIAKELTAIEKKELNSHMKIQASLPNGRTAFATLSANKLHELAFISTYSTRDPQSPAIHKEGYQRDPMHSRFPQIGRYFSKPENKDFIPPLLVNVRVYTPAEKNKFLTLFNKADVKGIHKAFGRSVFSIIDGQHRSGGLYWAWANMEDWNEAVPVHMIFGLKFEDEAQKFDDVNTTQRKLAKALIEITKLHLNRGEESHAQKVREAGERLAKDADSVWYGKVNMTGKPGTGLSMTYEGVRGSLNRMLPATLLTRLESRGMNEATVVKKYWHMIAEACAPAWEEHQRQEDGAERDTKYRLKELAGFWALCTLGRDLINTALDKSENDDEFWDAMTDLVSKLSVVDWEKRSDNAWMVFGAGKAGGDALYPVLHDLVYADKYPGISG